MVFHHSSGNLTKVITMIIFPVLLTVRPEFLKPELMATECWRREKLVMAE